MPELSAATFFYVVAFLLPGFWLTSTTAKFVPRGDSTSYQMFFQLLAGSIATYAFGFPLLYFLLFSGYFTDHVWRSWLGWVGLALVLPLILGTVFGISYQKNIWRQAFHRIGISTIHHMPTAWDYTFQQLTAGTWVLVTLHDGSTIKGLFGSSSFAADSSRGDLYLQAVYRQGENGWEVVGRTAGILVKGEEIRYIEFWSDESGGEHGEGE